jgi:hypothetical protein
MELKIYVCDACGKRYEVEEKEKFLHGYSFLSRDYVLNGNVCQDCMDVLTTIEADNKKVLAAALRTAMERRKEQVSV